MMRRKNDGAVAVYVLLTTGVLLTATLGVSNLALQGLQRVRQDRNSVLTEQASFAALDQAISKSYYDLDTNSGKLVYTSLNVAADVNSITPGATAQVYITPTADKIAYITAVVTYKGITRSVRSYITEKDVGIWNNAIFAGSGATGQAINGNVDIRGSVHILGDGEPYTDLNGSGSRDAAEAFTDKNKNGIWDPGEVYTDSNGDGAYTVAEPYNDTNGNGAYDPPLTQTDMDTTLTGSAYIGNNYSGVPANILAVIPAAPTVGGVAQLGTEVRVKHGMISIGGAASVGTSSIVDGGLSKGSIDGSYVNDGYTGNKGASAVSSDNGTTNTYDLGGLNISMPIISGIGAQQYKDKTGSMWSTHQAYLDSKSLTIPVSTLTSGTAAFTYGPDANGNSISFKPASGGSPAEINITGIVKVAGNLQLGNPKELITYKGKGTLYAAGDMNIDADIMPASGLTFPTGTHMGFIALKNMNLATGAGSSHLSMAGAFYAQGQIKSAKQTEVAGTFVSNFFDMGKNVPKIYQVPTLASNMPPGMPGDKHYYSFKVRSFRDRSPLPGQADTFQGGTPYSG
ncbi:MAG: hypothetical protein QOJ65_146 [Fimbriimonadaceae bacterium]|jgi:hypothetical protein|nr:hypothetical protein [Fimbriimonadaceae bacterium]